MKKEIGFGIIGLNVAILTVIILLISVSPLVGAIPDPGQTYDNSSKLMAVSSFSDQPVLNELGQDWEDYINADGSHTRRQFLGPKNYWNGSGYEPIDPTIVGETGSFKVEKGVYSVRWSNSNTFKIEKDSYHLIYQGKELSSGKSRRVLSSIKEGKGEKNKNKIKFKDIYQNIDVEYIYYPEMLKENIILNRAPEKSTDQSDTLDFSGYIEYSKCLEMWMDGARIEAPFTTSNAIEFRAGGKVVFTLPAPVIIDDDNSTIAGDYEVVKENGRILLSVKVPYDWLLSPSRAYPVKIDPTLSIKSSADTYVSQSDSGKNYGNYDNLIVQSSLLSDKRVLLRFYLTSTLPAGATISSARLKMFAQYSNTGRTIDVWSVNDYWNEYGVTWNSQPAHISWLSSTSSETGWQTWTITDKVRSRWGQDINLKIMDSSEGYIGFERPLQQYYSWDYAVYNLELDPYLEIVYDVPPPQNDCNTGGDASNTFSGANLIPGTITCSGYMDSSDSNDWYKFNVNQGDKITVSMTPSSNADFDLKLYNPGYADKASSANGAGVTDSVTFIADSPGEWRALVYYFDISGTYSLSVKVEPAIVQNDCGFGSDASNNFGGANLISSLPKTCTGYLDPSDRDDYYKFNVASGYTIDASMTPSSGADFDLQMLDPYNNLKIYSKNGAGLMDSVSYLADTPGDWRIRVYHYSGSGTYSLGISVADKTPPVVSITSPVNNAVLTSPAVQVNWAGSDLGSGINRYEVQLDGGSWNNKGTSTSHTFIVVQGDHYVNIKAFDNAGNTKITSVYFTAQLILPDLSISPEDITFEKQGGN